jgi:hypothetical protein
MSDKLKILAIHTQGGGVGYYRHFLPMDALKRAGHNVMCLKGDTDFFNDLAGLLGKPVDEWLYHYAADYDVVHMGYTTTIAHVATAAAIRNMALEKYDKELPIIVDIDDDPFNVPSYNTAYKNYTRTAQARRALLMHLRSADACTISTPQIEGVLKTESRNFSVLPNYCNPGDWTHYPHDPRRSDDKAVRLMFCGGYGHLGDLAQVEQPLTQLMGEMDGKEGRPLLRLFFLGCTPPWAAQWMPNSTDPHANRAFYIQPCHYSVYWQAIKWLNPDILIAPVEMNQFNESKSLIKAYDAVIGGSAFVCTDWATYGEVPTEGCWKVRGDVQWYETLKALALDPAMRAKKAANLKQWVFDTRNINNYTYKWEEVYQQALSRPVIKDISDIIRPRIIREVQ